MLKNVLPETMKPYGVVKYNGKWYVTFAGKGSAVNVYTTKQEALHVAHELFENYVRIYQCEEGKRND